MVYVISMIPVGHWCLWRHRLECWMPRQSSHRGIESRIRESLNTDITIVVGILDQPFHSVIGITGFIGLTDVLLLLLIELLSLLERTDILEVSLRMPFASHVLIDQDILCINIRRATKTAKHPIKGFARRTCIIAGACHQDRMLLGVVDRLIDDCMEPYSITHLDVHLTLCIMLLKILIAMRKISLWRMLSLDA